MIQDKLAVLRDSFGYGEFREGQEPLVDALTAGRDAMGVMPTGAGKSLCYQVPALLRQGTALVISPLISLMKDQVNALCQAGVAAAFLNSSQGMREQEQVLEEARGGGLRILYVAPERLDAAQFVDFARGGLSLVAVDEAHCVSQWGQDFRPSYLRIREFIDALPQRPPVGAFTATATARVREDIRELLGLRDPVCVTTGFDRPNLFFEVQAPRKRYDTLRQFLAERPDKSGIVYCLTRKQVEEVCDNLNRDGVTATRYHAGLGDRERRENQERFQTDEVRVMVATNAFGMGIDKSNVAFVVHFGMPKNMESYYQEAGRAGRDGSPAECLLLYSGQDVVTNRFLIDRSRDNESMDPEALAGFKARERERLKLMTFYCNTPDCLRAYILRYFSQQAGDYCGNCGSCVNNAQRTDITVEAQKILSCVKRMGENYGGQLVIQVLRGRESERIQSLGFDKLSTFGIMAGTGVRQLRAMILYLQERDCLRQTGDEYPVLRLGPAARGVLFGGERLSMNLFPDREKKAARTPKRAKVEAVANPRLFAKLQALRRSLAQAQGVPAYVVFPDATLRQMCEYMPTGIEELARIHGVGQAKLQRYGKAFLELIRQEKEGGGDGE